MTAAIFETIPLLKGALISQLNCHVEISALFCIDSEAKIIEFIANTSVDLLWLDGSIKSVIDENLIRKLKKITPDLIIAVFGLETDILEVKILFKQGISAYIPKSSSADEIDEAIHVLARGKSYLPPSFQQTLNFWISTSGSEAKNKKCLTQREKEVLELIVNEFTTVEIAKKLFISQCTVETHRLKLIQKLGVKNTAGLVREAVTNQLCYCF